MEQRKQYTIPLQSLSEGVHTLDFTITKEFIELQQIENMLNVEVTAQVIFTKRAQVHTLELNMKGKVEVPCDRCLEPVTIAIKNSQECIVKIASENDELIDTENVILIDSHEKEIDITHLFYENILLALPLKRAHTQGKCNTAMTAYISEAHKIKQETIDPRWDLLRNINTN